MKYIICDIDGVLADHRHRLHFILDQDHKDYNQFYAAMVDDTEYPDMVEFVRGLRLAHHILFITGRPDKYLDATARWLNDRSLFSSYAHQTVLMRKSGDWRKAPIIKQELFESLRIPSSEVLFAIDDDPEVLEMWAKLGIHTLHVIRRTR